MHQYDQFKQDMEKLHKADLKNPIIANRSEPDKPNSDKPYIEMNVPDKNSKEYSELLKELSNIKAGPIRENVMPNNLFRFNSQHTIPNCTVITLDGLDGFMWIGPDGVRHNEGLRWPTMRIEQNCTVEVLTDEYGRESKGWYKDNGTEI